MITEHVLATVSEGREAEFENSLRQALPIIESAPHCHGTEFRWQVENPRTFLLLVRWDSVADHMAFRESDLFSQWRALTHPFYEAPAVVTHFQEPLAR